MVLTQNSERLMKEIYYTTGEHKFYPDSMFGDFVDLDIHVSAHHDNSKLAVEMNEKNVTFEVERTHIGSPAVLVKYHGTPIVHYTAPVWEHESQLSKDATHHNVAWFRPYRSSTNSYVPFPSDSVILPLLMKSPESGALAEAASPFALPIIPEAGIFLPVSSQINGDWITYFRGMDDRAVEQFFTARLGTSTLEDIRTAWLDNVGVNDHISADSSVVVEAVLEGLDFSKVELNGGISPEEMKLGTKKESIVSYLTRMSGLAWSLLPRRSDAPDLGWERK
ncbi:hypothetical protein GMA3_76 [Gordonia phage GMA3]|uniref:Uncharacterized protein n=1 Tax=Gordonia phage GMA3 TaxID=1647284 RepID=A0A0K0NL01_9CAUD|nr:hypothetical protein AU105_gp076 [Gordonia phage GMA3]AKL88253.1 hypothetical protein GMA3_76 [Gordonia phage GMA3]